MNPTFSSGILDSSEIWYLVPIWLGVVVKRNRIYQIFRCSSGFSANTIRHADDGSRVHSSTQLCEDRGSGIHAPTHRLLEQRQEVLFVFSVRFITYLISMGCLPMRLTAHSIFLDGYVVCRRDGYYSSIGCQIASWSAREIAGCIMAVQGASSVIKRKGLKVRRPNNFLSCVLEIKRSCPCMIA